MNMQGFDNDSPARIESAKTEIDRKRTGEGAGRDWLVLAKEAAEDYGLTVEERTEMFRQLA